MIHDNALVAARDPLGFRPLYVGTSDGLTVVASETCAFDILKIADRRQVDPSEQRDTVMTPARCAAFRNQATEAWTEVHAFIEVAGDSSESVGFRPRLG